MKWLKGKLQNFKYLEIDSEKNNTYRVNLAVKRYIPNNENETNNIDESNNIAQIDNNDIQYLSVTHRGIPSTFDLKLILIELQKEYDKSEEVNRFVLNGISGWFDSAKRSSLKMLVMLVLIRI